MIISGVLLFVSLLSSSPAAKAIKPILLNIEFPKQGFKSITDETTNCPIQQSDTTVRIGHSQSRKIYLKDCFLSGSGRWHTITIGLGDSDSRKPSCGVKLSTSTVGWITLRDFEFQGLNWLEDVDNDGNSEVIIWQSFSDPKYFSTATNGLIPFAYKLVGNKLKIDANSTCIMINETLHRYQKTIEFFKSNLGKSWSDQDMYQRITDILLSTKAGLCHNVGR